MHKAGAGTACNGLKFVTWVRSVRSCSAKTLKLVSSRKSAPGKASVLESEAGVTTGLNTIAEVVVSCSMHR